MTADDTRRFWLDKNHAMTPASFRSLLEIAGSGDHSSLSKARLLLAGSHARLIGHARDERFSEVDRAFLAALAVRVAAGEFGHSTENKQKKPRRTLKNMNRPKQE